MRRGFWGFYCLRNFCERNFLAGVLAAIDDDAALLVTLLAQDQGLKTCRRCLLDSTRRPAEDLSIAAAANRRS